jgi:hypothetical protein
VGPAVGGAVSLRSHVLDRNEVRFIEPFRPEAVEPGAVGIIVEIEPLPAVIGPPQRLRARFGNYISTWLMRGQLEAVD